ncbi:hypothetical protein Hanom_Chr12g01083131 [Helianthus anomalus]
MSHGDSSTKKRTGKCHASGKVVHNEEISLLTVNEDPALSKMRRRGWYLASRCTVHVCNSRDMFVDYQPWTGHEVVLDFSSRAEVAGIGSVELHFTTGKVVKLLNVFHIPTVMKCLLSACILLGNEYIISINASGATIEKNHEIVGKGYLEDGLIRMSIIKPDSEPAKGMV